MKNDFIDHLAVCTDNINKSVDWLVENFPHLEVRARLQRLGYSV